MFQTLITTENSSVKYQDNAIEKNYFDELKNSLEWKHEKVFCFGKLHTPKRATIAFGDKNLSYKYSGKIMYPYDWKDSKLVLNLKNQVEDILHTKGMMFLKELEENIL